MPSAVRAVEGPFVPLLAAEELCLLSYLPG